MKSFVLNIKIKSIKIAKERKFTKKKLMGLSEQLNKIR